MTVSLLITPTTTTLPKLSFGRMGTFVPLKVHDALLRCKGCELKFTREELQMFAGYLICKYCMQDLEKNLKGVGHV